MISDTPLPESVTVGDTKIEVKQISSVRRNSKDLSVLAADLNICPFEILLHIAANNAEKVGHVGSIPLDLRLQAAKEAAQYLHAKKRAVEISGDQDKPLNLTFDGDMLDVIRRVRGKG